MSKLPPGNRLLAKLSPETLSRLEPHIERIDMPVKLRLYEAGQSIKQIYFPDTAIASLVASSKDAASLEVGLVGREGMLDLPAVLGTDAARQNTFIQVAGEGRRIAIEPFREELARQGDLGELLSRYIQFRLTHLAQTAVCNRFHTVEERCARWLLMTHDRVAGDELRLTQEFLSFMLGVRRTAVTIAAGNLQQTGYIRYRHGKITVVDRAGLRQTACGCYGVTRAEYERLLG